MPATSLVSTWVSSLNAQFAGAASAGFPASCFTLTLPAGFVLSVGPAGSIDCTVSGNPSGCPFNPTILDVPMLPGATDCGNGVTGPGELCDDGNFDALDGCSPICETEQVWIFSGMAVGGFTIEFTLDGVPVVVTTTAGQTAEEVPDAIAHEIAEIPDFANSSLWVTSLGNRVVTNGVIADVVINDPGISHNAIPGPAGHALAALAAILVAVGGAVLYRLRGPGARPGGSRPSDVG